MDRNQKQHFWSMVLIGYTGGSLLCMLITCLTPEGSVDLSYIRMVHLYLFLLMLSISWIWVKLYRQGMGKKAVWKVRLLMLGTMLLEFFASQMLYRLVHEGTAGAAAALPKVLLIGCAGIVVCMLIWYIVYDSIEKSSLKRINEKLSRNKRQ